MAVKHQSKLPKLNRDSNHRKSLFKTQLRELIENGLMTTTLPKAKIIKRLFDKLVTSAKGGTLASRRRVITALGNAKTANKLVDSIVPVMADRNSGYTTLKKVSIRKGDATTLATLKLVAVPVEVPKETPKVTKSVTKKTK